MLAAHGQVTPRSHARASLLWLALAAAVVALVATQLSPAQAIEGIWRRVVPKPTAAPTAAPPTGLELPARGRLLVNDRLPERSSDVVIFLDALGAAATSAASTLDRAVRAAASLSDAYLRRRDRVG